MAHIVLEALQNHPLGTLEFNPENMDNILYASQAAGAHRQLQNMRQPLFGNDLIRDATNASLGFGMQPGLYNWSKAGYKVVGDLWNWELNN